jgi:hypothetical protein
MVGTPNGKFRAAVREKLVMILTIIIIMILMLIRRISIINVIYDE